MTGEQGIPGSIGVKGEKGLPGPDGIRVSSCSVVLFFVYYSL